MQESSRRPYGLPFSQITILAKFTKECIPVRIILLTQLLAYLALKFHRFKEASFPDNPASILMRKAVSGG